MKIATPRWGWTRFLLATQGDARASLCPGLACLGPLARWQLLAQNFREKFQSQPVEVVRFLHRNDVTGAGDDLFLCAGNF